MPKPNRFARNDGQTAMSQHKNKRFIYRVEAQLQTPFFTLPAEIREQIYRFVLPRSYRKSLSPRRCIIGYEEEWGRTKYNDKKGWTPFEQYPQSLWTRGNLGILCVCRRMNNEALPLFYKNNCFDLSIRGDEPELRIAYFPWPLPSSRCMFPNMSTYGGIRWSKGTKRLTNIKRDYVRLIRCWSVMAHTHYAGEGKDWKTAAQETSEAWEDEQQIYMQRLIMPQGNQSSLARAWMKRYCATLSGERAAYRNAATECLLKWVNMLDGNEEQIRQISISFEAYSDYKGMAWMADVKLVRAVREHLPEWMLDKVFLLGGKIPDHELEAWELD